MCVSIICCVLFSPLIAHGSRFVAGCTPELTNEALSYALRLRQC